MIRTQGPTGFAPGPSPLAPPPSSSWLAPQARILRFTNLLSSQPLLAFFFVHLRPLIRRSIMTLDSKKERKSTSHMIPANTPYQIQTSLRSSAIALAAPNAASTTLSQHNSQVCHFSTCAKAEMSELSCAHPIEQAVSLGPGEAQQPSTW